MDPATSSTDTPQQTEDAIVRGQMERYRVAADFDRPFKERHLIDYLNLHNVLPTMNWPFWSDHFEPVTQVSTTETAEKIIQGLFPKDRYFDLKPQEGQDELATEKTRELVAADLRRAKFKLQKLRQTDEAVSYGNGVEFHFVDLDIVDSWGRVPRYDEFKLLVGYDDVLDARMEFCPRSKILSRFDCYPATTGSMIPEMPYFQHRELVPLEALRQAFGRRWRNVDKLQGFLTIDSLGGRAGLEDEDLAFDLYERLAAIGLRVTEGLGSVKGAGAVEYVELLYETVAPPGRPGCAHWRCTGNRRWLLFDEPFPQRHKRKPYSEIKYLERGSNLWQADGLPRLLEPLQRKLNLRSNQASDSILLDDKPPILVGDDANVQDLTLLDHWPDRKIRVADVGAIRELRREGQGRELFADMDLTYAMIQRVTKLFDATRNLGGARTGVGEAGKTATGARLFAGLMNTAVNFKLLLNEEMGFKDGIEIYLALRQQLHTRDARLPMQDPTNPVFGKAGLSGLVTISPMDVGGRFEVEVLGSSQTLDTPEVVKAARDHVAEGFKLPDVARRLKQVDLWIWGGELLSIPGGLRRFVRTDAEQSEYESRQMQEQIAQAEAARAAMPALPTAEGPTQSGAGGPGGAT